MNKHDMSMEFIEATNFEELSSIGAGVMVDMVKQKPDALICLASGNSPTMAYEMFVERVLSEIIDISKLRILKLDEWWGVLETDPSTCEYYIQEKIIKPLNIPEGNYISFNSEAPDPKTECQRISKLLRQQGPIDLCILGMGKNGHLGLNEPGSYFIPFSHVTELDARTKTHEMLVKTGTKVDYGMTIGMADIIASEKILLLATGDYKNQVYKEFLKAEVRTDLPASVLWLHPNTVCVYEKQLIY